MKNPTGAQVEHYELHSGQIENAPTEVLTDNQLRPVPKTASIVRKGALASMRTDLEQLAEIMFTTWTENTTGRTDVERQEERGYEAA